MRKCTVVAKIEEERAAKHEAWRSGRRGERAWKKVRSIIAHELGLPLEKVTYTTPLWGPNRSTHGPLRAILAVEAAFQKDWENRPDELLKTAGDVLRRIGETRRPKENAA